MSRDERQAPSERGPFRFRAGDPTTIELARRGGVASGLSRRLREQDRALDQLIAGGGMADWHALHDRMKRQADLEAARIAANRQPNNMGAPDEYVTADDVVTTAKVHAAVKLGYLEES